MRDKWGFDRYLETPRKGLFREDATISTGDTVVGGGAEVPGAHRLPTLAPRSTRSAKSLSGRYPSCRGGGGGVPACQKKVFRRQTWTSPGESTVKNLPQYRGMHTQSGYRQQGSTRPHAQHPPPCGVENRTHQSSATVPGPLAMAGAVRWVPVGDGRGSVRAAVPVHGGPHHPSGPGVGDGMGPRPFNDGPGGYPGVHKCPDSRRGHPPTGL